MRDEGRRSCRSVHRVRLRACNRKHQRLPYARTSALSPPQGGITSSGVTSRWRVAYSPYAGPFGLFLLPGGRPRLLVAVIQAGGRPRRLPRLRATRSRVMIASSTRSRSWHNSANIFVMSISQVYGTRLGFLNSCLFLERTGRLLKGCRLFFLE
jgi:hypothetical protein